MKVVAITLLGLAYFFWIAIRREAGKAGKVWLWDFMLYAPFAALIAALCGLVMLAVEPTIPVRYVVLGVAAFGVLAGGFAATMEKMQ